MSETFPALWQLYSVEGSGKVGEEGRSLPCVLSPLKSFQHLTSTPFYISVIKNIYSIIFTLYGLLVTWVSTRKLLRESLGPMSSFFNFRVRRAESLLLVWLTLFCPLSDNCFFKRRKINLDSYWILYGKINCRWNKDMNKQNNTIKTLEKNLGH